MSDPWKKIQVKGRIYEYRDSDPSTDADLLEEMTRLNGFFGLSTTLYIGRNSGAHAISKLGILIDRAQIQDICKSISRSPDKAKSVAAYVMAHEQCHMYQWETQIGKKSDLQEEAHADLVGATYLGLFLGGGGITPGVVADAAFSIGSAPGSTHPTKPQREELASSGMSAGAQFLSIRIRLQNLGLGANNEWLEAVSTFLNEESWRTVDEILTSGRVPFGNSGIIHRI